MKAATYKDLQNNLDHYVEDVVDNQEPLMVPDKGVVILSLEDYESTAERYICCAQARCDELSTRLTKSLATAAA